MSWDNRVVWSEGMFHEPEAVDVHVVWPKVSHLRPKVRYVVDELVRLCEQWQ